MTTEGHAVVVCPAIRGRLTRRRAARLAVVHAIARLGASLTRLAAAVLRAVLGV